MYVVTEGTEWLRLEKGGRLRTKTCLKETIN